MLRQTQVEPPWHTAETSLADALKPPTPYALQTRIEADQTLAKQNENRTKNTHSLGLDMLLPPQNCEFNSGSSAK